MWQRVVSVFVWICLALAATAWAQKSPPQNQAPPRSDRDSEAGESSSKSTRIDLSPPKDDAKNHPGSGGSTGENDPDASDVQEFHPWNPYKASKDVEVGDFYFK